MPWKFVGCTYPPLWDMALASYNANGSFDTDGKLTTAFNSYGDLTAIYVQEDGKLLAIGSGDNGVDSDVVLARYNDNGALDTTFDTDGKRFIDLGGSEGAYKIARQEDRPGGSLVVRCE